MEIENSVIAHALTIYKTILDEQIEKGFKNHGNTSAQIDRAISNSSDVCSDLAYDQMVKNQSAQERIITDLIERRFMCRQLIERYKGVANEQTRQNKMP